MAADSYSGQREFSRTPCSLSMGCNHLDQVISRALLVSVLVHSHIQVVKTNLMQRTAKNSISERLLLKTCHKPQNNGLGIQQRIRN